MKKKLFVVAGFASLVLLVGLLVHFQPRTAGAESLKDEVEVTDLEDSRVAPLQVTNAGCAKIKCGSCPGKNCKIGGICCYVPGKGGARDKDGVASCGCNAKGEPVCSCKVGQPR